MAGRVSRICTVYGLASTEDRAIRYVGQTLQKPERRRANHLKLARQGASGPRHSWIRKVLADGFDIVVVVLEASAVWDVSERRWIAEMRQAGADLVNVSDGGGQYFGYSLTPERKGALSVASKAKWQDDDYRRKVLQGHQAYWTDDRRASKAIAVTGSTLQDVHKAKIGESLRRHYEDDAALKAQQVRLDVARASATRVPNLLVAVRTPAYRDLMREKVKEIWRKRREGTLSMPNHKKVSEC